MPEPISEVSTGRNRSAGHARGQQVAEQDPGRPVLGGDDCRPEVVGAVHTEAARDIRGEHGRVQVRVGQLDVGSWHDGRGELDVTAQQGGRQGRGELLPVLDDADLVVVRAGVGRGVRNRHRDVLAEVVRGCRPEAGQRVDELLQARGDVAGAGGGDIDGCDGAQGRDRGGGAGTLVGDADGVGDRHGGRGVVARAAVENVNRADADRRNNDGSPGRVHRCPVEDGHCRSGGVAGARGRHGDSVDNASGGHRRCPGGGNAGRGRWAVRDAASGGEVDDWLGRVAAAAVGDGEVIDAAAHLRSGLGGDGATARDRDAWSREAESGLGDRVAGDDARGDHRSRCGARRRGHRARGRDADGRDAVCSRFRSS